MTAPRTPVPDLLRRFIPTPYKLIAQGFAVETNDLDLLEQFDQRTQLHALSAVARNFHIKVIRDAAAPNESEEVRVICSRNICTLLAGMGTILLVDRELRRVFSFVASSVSREQFVNVYLVAALRHAEGHEIAFTEMTKPYGPSNFESLQTSDKSDNRV